MSTPTTHDLVRRLAALVASLEDAGGELTPESQAELEAALLAAEDKGEALVATVRRLELEAEEAKGVARRYVDRSRALERASERLRSGLLLELLRGRAELGETSPIRTLHGSAYLQTTTSVVGPDDASAWPGDCRRVVTTTTPDRGAAKRLLEAGADLGPVRLHSTTSVRIRA